MPNEPSPARLSLYLLPIVGTLPALWTLSRHQENHQARNVSRLAILLALSWLIAYSLLGVGSSVTPSPIWSIRLLYLDGLITSGYFVTCLVLLIRLWRGKTPKLPGMSTLANQLFRSRSV
ncbi:MAG: hypothetical protein GVY17_08710 [Cyanobacteria bacterium]|jgi:hypothetical protein|nr:hypothetical protein [Cyanobacteria bacterium GSL.Bin21]